MTDLAQGSYGQAWTALTELCWEAWMLPTYSQYNKPCDLLSSEHLTRGWKYCMKSKSLKAKSSSFFLGCTWPGTSVWWDSRHPRWFLSRMHSDSGMMGHLFKGKKKKKGWGDNSHQTEVIYTTLLLLKDIDHFPLLREAVGRGTFSKIQGSLAEDSKGTCFQPSNFSYFQQWEAAVTIITMRRGRRPLEQCLQG